MATQVGNGMRFRGKGMSIKTFVIYSAGGAGTFKLQALAGNDPDADNWVDIPDSSVTGSSVFSYHMSEGHRYQVVITGDTIAFND